jgi:hypothetical protein
VAGLVIQVAVALLPWSSQLLGDSFVPPPLWGVVAAGAVLSWAAAEGISRVVWRRASRQPGSADAVARPAGLA